jgi:hypothetical protein
MENISADNFIAICAGVVALCALGVSLWQGWTMRQHNKLSVKPFLSFRISVSKSKDEMGVRIYNSGLGPAIIKQLIVYVDKKPYTIKGYEDWKTAGGAAKIFDRTIRFSTFAEKEAVRAGESLPIISYPKEGWTEKGLECFPDALSRIRIKIIYASAYKEIFEVTTL